MLDRVLDALGTLRSPFAPYEADLHLRVGECLRDAESACARILRSPDVAPLFAH